MPKYADFDLDLQNTNSCDASTNMAKTGPDCIVYSGRPSCDPVPQCEHTNWGPKCFK